MKKLLAIASAIGLILSSVTSAQAEMTGGVWKIKADSVALNLSGVSPFVEKTSNGDRIWFASPSALPDPIMVVDCSDLGSCSRQTLSSRFGSDATVVTLKDGSRKVFFVEMGPSGKKIRFATISGNTLSHGAVSDLGVEGSSVSAKELAWGVPDAVSLPDGRVRVYWVLSDPALGNSQLPETIVSATSTDSTANSFVRDPGTRLTGGYVDSEVLRAEDGDWVMITSTGPGAGTQYLYIATSADGLQWNINKNPISSPDESALDPSGYQLTENTWRIYYVSAEPGMRVDRNYQLKRATLGWKKDDPKSVASPTPSATSTPEAQNTVTPTPVAPAKKITITCLKGKSVKKVTAVSPKCPAGFKKK
ncbi:MAG: hypothetical protein RL381_1013 [Actinomycetota bacterium]|jgi:hypothetical protein